MYFSLYIFVLPWFLALCICVSLFSLCRYVFLSPSWFILFVRLLCFCFVLAWGIAFFSSVVISLFCIRFFMYVRYLFHPFFLYILHYVFMYIMCSFFISFFPSSCRSFVFVFIDGLFLYCFISVCLCSFSCFCPSFVSYLFLAFVCYIFLYFVRSPYLWMFVISFVRRLFLYVFL